MSNGETQSSSFERFDLHPEFVDLLKADDILEPTPVQLEAIPVIQEGHDIIGVAQTGTGKTLAFVLPIVNRLTGKRDARNAVLAIEPTRELAHQTAEVFEAVGAPFDLHVACVYGGVSIRQQAQLLRSGVAIIVATPGRLLDHMGRGNMNFRNLHTLVLDEADRMLDMGFWPDISRIVRKLPKERQTLMFSATFPAVVERAAREVLSNPRRVEVGQVAKPVENVREKLYAVHHGNKMPLLMRLLERREVDSALVFVRTKHRTDELGKALKNRGFKARVMHGDRPQPERQRSLDGFREGKYKFLIATDIAARGLDIRGVTHVINYDIPDNPEDYIHRIGRTARASCTGDAITFVSPSEMLELEAIERSLGKNIPREEWEGSVPVLGLYKPKGTTPATRRRPSRRRRR